MASPAEGDHLEPVIASACRLVANSLAVRGVTVVAGRRLTYDELARLRALAEACRVRLTMDGTGDVRLQPVGVRPEPIAGQTSNGKRGPMGGQRAGGTPRWRTVQRVRVTE